MTSRTHLAERLRNNPLPHMLPLACALFFLLFLLLLHYPFRTAIDRTVTLPEYRMMLPDYQAGERTVTVQGILTRTLLGNWSYEGRLAVSGDELSAQASLSFSSQDSRPIHLNYRLDGEYVDTTIGYLLVEGNFDQFAIFFARPRFHEDGSSVLVTDFDSGRFLCYGGRTRGDCLRIMKRLARHSALEDLSQRWK